jgi:hypothetical protein
MQMAKRNKEGLTIDWETASRITVCELAEQHSIVAASLKKLRKRVKQGEELARHEVEDLAQQEITLAHLKYVVEYYGGNV